MPKSATDHLWEENAKNIIMKALSNQSDKYEIYKQIIPVLFKGISELLHAHLEINPKKSYYAQLVQRHLNVQGNIPDLDGCSEVSIHANNRISPCLWLGQWIMRNQNILIRDAAISNSITAFQSKVHQEAFDSAYQMCYEEIKMKLMDEKKETAGLIIQDITAYIDTVFNNIELVVGSFINEQVVTILDYKYITLILKVSELELPPFSIMSFDELKVCIIANSVNKIQAMKLEQLRVIKNNYKQKLINIPKSHLLTYYDARSVTYKKAGKGSGKLDSGIPIPDFANANSFNLSNPTNSSFLDTKPSLFINKNSIRPISKMDYNKILSRIGSEFSDFSVECDDLKFKYPLQNLYESTTVEQISSYLDKFSEDGQLKALVLAELNKLQIPTSSATSIEIPTTNNSDMSNTAAHLPINNSQLDIATELEIIVKNQFIGNKQIQAKVTLFDRAMSLDDFKKQSAAIDQLEYLEFAKKFAIPSTKISHKLSHDQSTTMDAVNEEIDDINNSLKSRRYSSASDIRQSVSSTFPSFLVPMPLVPSETTCHANKQNVPEPFNAQYQESSNESPEQHNIENNFDRVSSNQSAVSINGSTSDINHSDFDAPDQQDCKDPCLAEQNEQEPNISEDTTVVLLNEEPALSIAPGYLETPTANDENEKSNESAITSPLADLDVTDEHERVPCVLPSEQSVIAINKSQESSPFPRVQHNETHPNNLNSLLISSALSLGIPNVEDDQLSAHLSSHSFSSLQSVEDTGDVFGSNFMINRSEMDNGISGIKVDLKVKEVALINENTTDLVAAPLSTFSLPILPASIASSTNLSTFNLASTTCKLPCPSSTLPTPSCTAPTPMISFETNQLGTVMGPTMMIPLSNEHNEIIGIVNISRLKNTENKSYNSLVREIEENIFDAGELKLINDLTLQAKEGFKKRAEKLQFIKSSKMAQEWMGYSHGVAIEFYLIEYYVNGRFDVFKYTPNTVEGEEGSQVNLMNPDLEIDLYKSAFNKCEIVTVDFEIYPFYDEDALPFGLVRIVNNRENIGDNLEQIEDGKKVINALTTAVTFFRNEQNGVLIEPILEGESLTKQSQQELLFARFLLTDLRQLLLSLDSSSIAEIKSYKYPPKVVLQVMQCVLYLFGKRPSDIYTWPSVVKFINFELLKKMASFDPTSDIRPLFFKRVEETIKSNFRYFNVAMKSKDIRKHGSLPTKDMFSWLIVSLHLNERAVKAKRKLNLFVEDVDDEELDLIL